jgi:alkylation response protein AidB-like acyl-CoA dehydrogenase
MSSLTQKVTHFSEENFAMWFFSEEDRMLQETVRQFARSELAPKIEKLDEEEGFNRESFFKLGELGLLGITVKEEDGGAGLGAVAATIAMEEMAAVDASTTLSYLAHSILCVNQIGANGSEHQKKHYLPKLISGEWIGGMEGMCGTFCNCCAGRSITRRRAVLRCRPRPPGTDAPARR